MPWYYGIIQASISGTVLALIAFVCTRYLYKWFNKKVLANMWVIVALRYLFVIAIPLEATAGIVMLNLNIPIEAYLIVLLILLVYYYNQYRQQIYHIRKLKNCTDPSTVELFEEIRQEFDTDNVVLRTEYSNDAPYTLGFINPKIIVSLQRLSPTDLPFVLRHELSHIKSYDCLKNLLFIAIRAVHFFNPFVYLFFPYARLAIEMACDENVLSNRKVDRNEYGNSLVNQASLIHHNIPMTTNYVPRTNSLKLRINALVSDMSENMRIISKLLLVVFFILAVLSLYPQTYAVQNVEDIEKEVEVVPSPNDEIEEPLVTTITPVVTTTTTMVTTTPVVTTITPVTTTTPAVTTIAPTTSTPVVTTTIPDEEGYGIEFMLAKSDTESTVGESYIHAYIKTNTYYRYEIQKVQVHYYDGNGNELGLPTVSYEAPNPTFPYVDGANMWGNTLSIQTREGLENLKFEIEYSNLTTNQDKVLITDYYSYQYVIDTFAREMSFSFNDEYVKMSLEDIKDVRKGSLYFQAFFWAKPDKELRVNTLKFNFYNLENLVDSYETDLKGVFSSAPNATVDNMWGLGVAVPVKSNATHIQIYLEYEDSFTGEVFTKTTGIKYNYDDFLRTFYDQY